MPPVGEFQVRVHLGAAVESRSTAALYFPYMMPPLLLRFLISVSWAGLRAGPWTPWNCTRNWVGLRLWAFCRQGFYSFSHALINDLVGSNLLYRVKRRRQGLNNSFHGSYGSNQDTWAVNLLSQHETRRREGQEPAGQWPSPSKISPASQTRLGFAGFNFPSLPPSLVLFQE